MRIEGAKVLIVEDEESHAELLQRAFEDDHEVFVARNLAAARRALDERRFDIVLTDVRLPDGLGMTLLEDDIDLAIVIMTSHGDERGAVDAIKRGAHDYVVKSAVAFEEMPRVVRRVLREQHHAKEQARLRAELARSERLASIGTAAAMLAHEIGNPLNSMSLSAQLIDRQLDKLDADVSDVRELNETIKREIKRLANLLNEFRGLARESDLAMEPVLVRELFDTAIDAERALLEASGVDVTTVPDGEFSVVANREKMQQVLVNLIQNAIEAMPTGGQVVLGARAAEDAVVLTVTDTGPGIPADIDVFTPFATTKEHGTGLGLAVVSQILASHGGRVWHERGPEGGARFCLQLLQPTD